MARRKNNTAGPAAARSAAHGAPSPAPAPATGPAVDDPAAAVLAALAANPDGATTAAIADAAGISRTAARDALTELETRGDAERTKGGRPGIPDTWRPAAAAVPEDAGATGSADPASPADDGPAAAEPDGQDEATAAPAAGDHEPGHDHPDASPADDAPAAVGPDGAGDQDTAGETGQDGTSEPGDGDDSQPADDAAGDSAEAAPDPAVIAETGGHAGQIQDAAAAVTTALQAGDLRAALAGIEEICEQASQARRTLKAAAGGKKAPAVRPGGLRDKVEAHLRDHPDGTFTPHEIHKVLGHSSGAIANALHTLVKHGAAELATEKPQRFRLASGTTAAPAGSGTASADGETSPAGDDEELVAGAA